MILDVKACETNGLTGPEPSYLPLAILYPDNSLDLTHILKGPADLVEFPGVCFRNLSNWLRSDLTRL